MDLGIKGRKAIICASSKGLGKGCAIALAEAGVDVVINGRNEEVLAQTAKEITDLTGVKVTAVAADVSTKNGQQALLAACPEPDILVNNNGGPPRRDFRELDRDDMIGGVISNMITPIELTQAVLDGMVARRFGRIVNVTSGAVKMPFVGLDLSSGARAGLTAFLSGISRTVADKNVTINNLLPGIFDTDRIRSLFPEAAEKSGKTVEEIATERADPIPAGRFGTPTEFGNTCAFMCSQHAAFMTGQNILVDGGMYNGTF